MKYYLTTDLSVTTFDDKYAPIAKDPKTELDYKDCLYFEASQTLNANWDPPSAQNELVYIISRKFRPYELFRYPWERLPLNGRLSCGTAHADSVSAQEVDASHITTTVLLTEFLKSTNGMISSISTDSISADYISSDLGRIDNISGTELHYNNGRFCDITATGIADMVAAKVKWADLAEMYHSDVHYDAGTLIEFNGAHEVTLARNFVNGCISERPAIILNSKIRNNLNSTPVVLSGRTRVKVTGAIEKFDRISLSQLPGIATKSNGCLGERIIGISLETNKNIGTKLVNCVIKLTI